MIHATDFDARKRLVVSKIVICIEGLYARASTIINYTCTHLLAWSCVLTHTRILIHTIHTQTQHNTTHTHSHTHATHV